MYRGMRINSVLLRRIGAGIFFLLRCCVTVFLSRLSARFYFDLVLKKHVFTRFCTCRVLSYGSTFYDLVARCADFVRSNIKVIYQQKPHHGVEYNARIIDLTMSSRVHKMTNFLDGQGDGGLEQQERKSLLQKRLELFLCIFNGDWNDTVNICHYCNIGCACGGLPQRQIADLAASLYVEVILAGRPTVPALSRWLKCSKTAKWFLSYA